MIIRSKSSGRAKDFPCRVGKTVRSSGFSRLGLPRHSKAKPDRVNAELQTRNSPHSSRRLAAPTCLAEIKCRRKRLVALKHSENGSDGGSLAKAETTRNQFAALPRRSMAKAGKECKRPQRIGGASVLASRLQNPLPETGLQRNLTASVKKQNDQNQTLTKIISRSFGCCPHRN